MGKRKLDDNGAPALEPSSKNPETSSTTVSQSTTTFQSLNLDPRILQAIAKAKFVTPTQVQERAIPPALEGRDILAKSKTGSGKTAAYVLPTIQSILLQKTSDPKKKTTAALVLVPTRELSDQITRTFASFAEYCSKEVRVLNLTQRVSDAVLSAKLQEYPDVVVSTPGRANQLLSTGGLSLDGVQHLVLDEADLLLSYGYEDDINNISKSLHRGTQAFLMSATLTPEIDQLKSLFCKDPVLVKIDEKEEQGGDTAQYVVKCGEEEKWLLVFVIFKLKLVKGKTIVFVADMDRGYRLKLYLEQFGIRSCVLNSELPINTRLRTVEEFNKGLYDILIAADDQEVIGGIHRKAKSVSSDHIDHVQGEFTDEDDHDEPTHIGKKQKTGAHGSSSKSTDFGVSRGIDFQNVTCVLNFDLPQTSKSYTHRIGRTARAGKSGMALSFVIPRDQYRKHPPTTHTSTRSNEKVLAKIIERQGKKGHEVKPYQFDMRQVEGFRYRMNDALRAVTRVAVREARAREIKQELIRSERLRKHFEENPDDLAHLKRHDGGALGGGGIVRVQGHLKHVPDYLMPGRKRNTDGTSEGNQEADQGLPAFGGGRDDGKRKRKTNKKGGSSARFQKRNGKRNDPLKSFQSGNRK